MKKTKPVSEKPVAKGTSVRATKKTSSVRNAAYASSGSKKTQSRAKSRRRTTVAARKQLVALTLDALKKQYPNPACALEYNNPFELLVAVILSAQCTDKRVNMTTPDLFKKFPDVDAFAKAHVEEIEEAIKKCGFYHSKAVNISRAAKKLVEEYGGAVPDDFEILIALPGVGRKTANCVLGNAFRIASGFVVDTHVLRLSRKIGLSDETSPEKVEADLNRLIPQEEWIDASHRLIYLGRQFCSARRPLCDECPLNSFCLKRS